MKGTLKNDRGLSLVVILMTMAILLSIAGAGFLFSRLNLMAAGNLKTGTAALQVADGAIQHAVAVIPWGSNFNSLLGGSVAAFTCMDQNQASGTCDGVNFKPTLTGSLSGYTYTVVVENDTSVAGETAMGDNNNRVILISTATGPNNSKRRVRAYVGRSTETWAPPGVVFLPGAPGNVSMSNFEGQSFRIDGGDHIPDNNTPGSGPKPSIPAIGTTNSSLTSNIVSWLANNQYNQIVGQGSDPSIVTTTSTIDVNQLATNLINLGVEGVDKQTLSPGVYDDGDWGTATSPKITHITGVGELQLIGNLKGYGVLITDLDVDVHIAGNFKWYGLMITRRHAHFNPNHFGAAPGGQSQLWGNIFIPENSLAKIDIGDQAKLRYSSRAFNDYAFTRWPSAFPKPAKIIAWQELMS